MKLPKGAEVNLSLQADGQMSLDVKAVIGTRSDARALAATIRMVGRSLPDTTPRGNRVKAIARRIVKRKRKTSESDPETTPTAEA